MPLLYQQGACALTRSVLGTRWKTYGLHQSRGALPTGPLTLMVHIASVWVPFTSESKEAVADYDEIVKEIRLALQTSAGSSPAISAGAARPPTPSASGPTSRSTSRTSASR